VRASTVNRNAIFRNTGEVLAAAEAETPVAINS